MSKAPRPRWSYDRFEVLLSMVSRDEPDEKLTVRTAENPQGHWTPVPTQSFRLVLQSASRWECVGEALPAHANVSFPCSSHLSATARQLSLKGPL